MEIRGTTIQIAIRTRTGVDDFRRPIYSIEWEDVADCLFSPASTDDLPKDIDLTGKRAIYTLAIPKGDTHDWKDCTVRFAGHIWKSIGFPIVGIEENVPLRWHTKVTVELYE